ncbi:hypothetical protein Q8A73_018499 [Channa argus]|nr:hypothetical protein Q8A73_018499 [Channa argus]
MDQSVWSKGTCSSSNICLDGCPAEHLTSFQPDHVPSNSDALTSHKDNENMLQQSVFYSSKEAGSSLICYSKLELNPSGESITRRHQSSGSRTSGQHDWNLNSGHQAKRARVENIIKGTICSPEMHCTEMMTNQHEETGSSQKKERINELPLHQEYIERSGSYNMSSSQTREPLKSRHQQLFQNVDEANETTDSSKEEKYHTWNNNSDKTQRNASTDSCKFENCHMGKDQGWKKVKPMNYFQTKPERLKLMADVLKFELSRAVSRSVDYIFKSLPLLQTSPNHEESVGTDISIQSSMCKDNKCRVSCHGNADVQVPDVQTEALSLVVQKKRLETSDQFVRQPNLRACPHQKPSVPFSVDSTVCKDQQPEKNPDTVHQHVLRCRPDESSEAKLETFGTNWNSVKVRSKVNSRSVRSPQTHAVDPMLLENLSLPHVKIEPDGLVKNNLYMLNEGLTTNHLKKAKLMFFYTRYPSSLVLKMCFHDVQFTRCITSQLIKWFSNFREFYYIQMEKFARHALIEGVTNVRGLTVGRESELFRALNMHYNKANDFQVTGTVRHFLLLYTTYVHT